MEENKIDPFQIIGFVILMAGLFWWIYTLPDIETKNVDNQSNNEKDNCYWWIRIYWE